MSLGAGRYAAPRSFEAEYKNLEGKIKDIMAK